eukprot:s668_g27.t1
MSFCPCLATTDELHLFARLRQTVQDLPQFWQQTTTGRLDRTCLPGCDLSRSTPSGKVRCLQARVNWLLLTATEMGIENRFQSQQ